MISKIFKTGWSIVGRLLYIFAHPMFYWFIKGSKRTRVALIVDDEVLVAKNWLSNGEYRLPGGGVDKGETWQQSAVREIYEELGIKIDEDKLEFLENYIAHKRGGEYEVWLCKIEFETKPELHPHSLEVIDYKWISIEDPLVKKSVWGKLTKTTTKNGN